MKKRDIATVVILHIITLGIYFFYWAYATRKELVARYSSPKSIPAFGWLILPYVALIPPLIMVFTLPEEGDKSAPALLAALWVAVGLYFFATLLACIVVFYWWFYRYCKVASAVTKSMELAPSYIILILATLASVPVVWQALIQRDINKLADRLADKGTPQSTNKD